MATFHKGDHVLEVRRLPTGAYKTMIDSPELLYPVRAGPYPSMKAAVTQLMSYVKRRADYVWQNQDPTIWVDLYHELQVFLEKEDNDE